MKILFLPSFYKKLFLFKRKRESGDNFFFEIKGRSTVVSFKKKAIVHNKPKRTPPPQKQRTQQHSTPLNVGE
jgi:hypothetical protein